MLDSDSSDPRPSRGAEVLRSFAGWFSVIRFGIKTAFIEASSSGKTRDFESRIAGSNPAASASPLCRAITVLVLVGHQGKFNPSTARARGGHIGLCRVPEKIAAQRSYARYEAAFLCAVHLRQGIIIIHGWSRPINLDGCDRCTGAGLKSSVVFQIPDSIQRMPVGKAGEGKVDVMSEAHGQKERFRRTNQIGVQAGV